MQDSLNSLHTKMTHTINDNYQIQSITNMPISFSIKLTHINNTNYFHLLDKVVQTAQKTQGTPKHP